MKEIKIECQGNRQVELNELQDFQGDLKELNEPEYLKLKNSIIKYGFAFPVIVWKNKIIDGHQRIFVLKKMVKEEGFTVGKIPVADINAKDEKDAKYKLLLFNSQYGKISEDGLHEFIETSGIDFDMLKDEISLSDFELSDFEDNFYKDNIPGGDINFDDIRDEDNYLLIPVELLDDFEKEINRRKEILSKVSKRDYSESIKIWETILNRCMSENEKSING